MKLVTRLWLLGALVPALGTIVLAVSAGMLLDWQLDRSLDRALLTQAAVESVSLFDGPEDTVHVHMTTSPLEEAVRGFVPSAAIYGQDGALVLSYPEHDPNAAPNVPPRDVHAPPQLSKRTLPDGTRLREVTNSLIGDEGKIYTLRISGSMAGIDRTMKDYWQVTSSGVAFFVMLLIVIQAGQARQLTGRLSNLNQHISHVREGRFDQMLPEDRAHDEIAELRDVLADATKKLKSARESQERLVADAAHELRTPLTIMRTGLDLALRRHREPEELREALENTRNEVDRLTALATRLLDLAVQGQASLDRASTDLRNAVLESVDAFLPEAERRHLTILTDLPEKAAAMAHAPSIRQALDNLLGNATKYAPAGSSIRVGLRRDGALWLFSVEDSGPGIPPANRESVFAPFHRGEVSPTEEKQSGAGLGLAIVREVATRHGGRAYVDDSASGARVVFEIAA